MKVLLHLAGGNSQQRLGSPYVEDFTMHHQVAITTDHREAAPQHLLMADRKREKQQHRQAVTRAQASLQSFIECLQQLPYRDGTYMLSMDLYAVFAGSCGIDLPHGFQTEFGRQITKACRDGRLPFKRKTVGRASLAAYDGLDALLLPALMGMEC